MLGFQTDPRLTGRKRKVGFDAQHIINGIWVGSDRAARSLGDLHQNRISHILNCAREIEPSPAQLQQFRYFHFPLDDHSSETLLSGQMLQAHQFIREAISQGQGVLIHCAMGISRSVSVAASFLMLEYHLQPDQALRKIQYARRIASPNAGFRRQLNLLQLQQQQALHHQNSTPSLTPIHRPAQLNELISKNNPRPTTSPHSSYQWRAPVHHHLSSPNLLPASPFMISV